MCFLPVNNICRSLIAFLRTFKGLFGFAFAYLKVSLSCFAIFSSYSLISYNSLSTRYSSIISFSLFNLYSFNGIFDVTYNLVQTFWLLFFMRIFPLTYSKSIYLESIITGAKVIYFDWGAVLRTLEPHAFLLSFFFLWRCADSYRFLWTRWKFLIDKELLSSMVVHFLIIL
jgi:hypothetical protein